MEWRVSDGRTCGLCGVWIPAGQPVALMTDRHLRRCEACAGAPVDGAQLNETALERQALREDGMTSPTATKGASQ